MNLFSFQKLGNDGKCPCLLRASRALNDPFFLQFLAKISIKNICLDALQDDFSQKIYFPLKKKSGDVFTCQLGKQMAAGMQTGGQNLTVASTLLKVLFNRTVTGSTRCSNVTFN